MSNEPLLSRSQAATFVGCRSESAIRAAEGRVLPCTRDASGQAWHSPAALDAWPWKNARPTDAVRADVLRDAAKERSSQSLRSAAGRELAWYKAADRADALEQKVARENDAARAAFLRDHIEDTDARALLFSGDSEARQKFRDVLRRRLLTEVPVPRARRVIGVHETAMEVEGQPVVWGGPFFAKADVYALRKEVLELAAEAPDVVDPAPTPPTPTTSAQTVSDVLTLLLAMAAEKERRGPPSAGP
jgi:hypothetical protein